jgi:folylpolyglutamate synthase/dihydropteroate synthase
VLGGTLGQIAREKLAVARDDSLVVLADDTYASLVPSRHVVHGGAREAAETFVGHALGGEPDILLPGRLERRDGEIRDGAHNLDGVRWLKQRLPPARYVVCASILEDKDADEMLQELAGLGEALVATQSSNARSLTAAALAELARPYFERVEIVPDPTAAVARAHELGQPVLVTGSLYLLADLEQREAP